MLLVEATMVDEEKARELLNRLLLKMPKPTEILQACPYDDQKNFGGRLTEEVFINEFFVSNSKYITDQQSFIRELTSSDWNNRVLFLHGFSGIGKTTFLRSIKASFQKNFYHVFIDFKTVNTKIGPQKNTESHFLKGLRKHLTSYDDVLIQSFIEFLSSRYMSFREYMPDTFEILQFKGSTDENLKMFNSIIDTTSFNDIFILFFSFLFYRAYTSNDQRIHLLYFDNLDAVGLDYIADNLKKCLPVILTTLSSLSQDKNIFDFDIDFVQNYKLIFCVRDANNAQINNCNANDIDRIWDGIVQLPIKIGHNAELQKLNFERRIEFINNKCPKDSLINTKYKRYNIPEIISILVNDELLFKEFLLPLYNYDYRKLNTNIYQVLEDSNINYEGFLYLYRHNKFGARANIIFGILRLLSNDNFIRKFKDIVIPETEEEGYCDPRRVILTVLLNACNAEVNNYSELFEIEREYALFDLIQILQGVYSDKTIMKVLLELYSVEKYGWVNLITVKNKYIDEDSEPFSEELEAIEEIRNLQKRMRGDKTVLTDIAKIRRTLNKIKIKVNPAAFSFLRHIIIHYEYFSVISHNTVPIHTLSAKPDMNNMLLIKENITNVLNTLKRYSKLINRFYDEVFENKLHMNPSEFKRSLFCFKYYGQNRVAKNEGYFYILRVVTTHIEYLDSLRLYIFETCDMQDDMIVEYNKMFIHQVKEYIKLLQNVKDPAKDIFLTSYKMNIEKIESENYRDTQTAITLMA